MALKRRFGGKAYYFDCQILQHGRASARAKELRKVGNLARVVKASSGYWEVWVRAK